MTFRGRWQLFAVGHLVAAEGTVEESSPRRRLNYGFKQEEPVSPSRMFAAKWILEFV